MTHELTIRVYYEDTDMAGIVYYANYLKFLERGRSEAVREAGVDQRLLRARDGRVFAVRHLAIDFRAPARFDDLLTVRSDVLSVGAAKLEMRQEIWRENRQICDATVRIACISTDGRPARMPADVRQRLAALAGAAR